LSDVAARRLHLQRLVGQPFDSAPDVVDWLVAVQSQDYGGAKWALGQRTREANEAELDRLYDAGAILRTHVLRPTWHFVRPEDVRWLVELTGPRVKAILGHYDGRLGVDAELLRRSHAAIEASLRGGMSLTRDELAAALAAAGIPAAGLRLGHVVMHAELDGLIISGPRRGKQHTYALFVERAPTARRLDRDEALAELTRRYFTSHGPAQVQDFTWWSGLTVADVRRGLLLSGAALRSEVIDGKTYWSSPDVAVPDRVDPIVHLLPNYDEFLVAYRDRSASLAPGLDPGTIPFPYGGLLSHVVVVNGEVRGGWKRRGSARQVTIELEPLGAIDAEMTAGLQHAAEHFSRFLGLPVSVERPRPGGSRLLPLPHDDLVAKANDPLVTVDQILAEEDL
jgi:hypothetical protein